MKYSLCIGAYPGKDVIYHLEKVKEHGFDGLEVYHWWDLDLPEIARAQKRLGIGINATCTRFFNLVDGRFREKYLSSLRETIVACQKLGVQSIITQTGNVIHGQDRATQRKAMVETLKYSSELCERAGVILEIEPLNGLIDHKHHFLQKSDEAALIIGQVDHPHVKLVFDIYHQQVTEGNVIRNATNYIDHINHFHMADNPGRNQPGTGELNFPNILQAIEETGYQGFVGLECGYTIDTDQALDRLKQILLLPKSSRKV